MRQQRGSESMRWREDAEREGGREGRQMGGDGTGFFFFFSQYGDRKKMSAYGVRPVEVSYKTYMRRQQIVLFLVIVTGECSLQGRKGQKNWKACKMIRAKNT